MLAKPLAVEQPPSTHSSCLPQGENIGRKHRVLPPAEHFFCFCLKFLFYIYLSVHMWRSEVKLGLYSHHMHSRDRTQVWQQAPLLDGVIEHVLILP